MQEAERLCVTSDSPACANVTLDQGGLEMDRGHFAEAQSLFERALNLARSREDHFLEANSMLSLSQSALQQEHYDDAVDWSDRTYRLATALDFQDIAQNALGNLGWAYYKLGEPERAEKLFMEAEGRATKLGDITDQIKWLTAVGYIYLDARDNEAAQRSYQRALDLAKQINSQEDIRNALMSLALVCERRGKFEQARDYADKGIAQAPAEGNPLDRLYPLLVKGHVAAHMRDTEQAEKTFREIEEDPKSHVFLKWEAEYSLAKLYEDESKPDSADREYRAALTTFETARSSLQHEESSLPFPANASRIYDDYIHFLVSQGKMAKGLQVAEYSRGRTLGRRPGTTTEGNLIQAGPVQCAGHRARGRRHDSFLLARREAILFVGDYRTEYQFVFAASEI